MSVWCLLKCNKLKKKNQTNKQIDLACAHSRRRLVFFYSCYRAFLSLFSLERVLEISPFINAPPTPPFPPPPPPKKKLVLVPATLAKMDHSPPSSLVTKINTFSLPGKRSLGICPVAHFILLGSHSRWPGREPFESLA